MLAGHRAARADDTERREAAHEVVDGVLRCVQGQRLLAHASEHLERDVDPTHTVSVSVNSCISKTRPL